MGICAHPQPLPASSLHLTIRLRSYAPHVLPCLLFLHLTLLEVMFCFTHSRLNPNFSRDDKSCDSLLSTLRGFRSKLSWGNGRQGSTGGSGGNPAGQRRGTQSSPLPPTPCFLHSLGLQQLTGPGQGKQHVSQILRGKE